MAHSGYFVVSAKDDGVYLNAFASPDGGAMPPLDELMHYLEAKKVDFGSAGDLKKAYDAAIAGQTAKVSATTITPFAGWAEYEVSTDGMQVNMKLYPGCAGLRNVDLAEVESDLANKNIKYGIDKQQINEAIRYRNYFTSVVIASGKRPVDGYDAELTYKFDTSHDNSPKVNDDGTVDFHSLDLINKVSAGDVVAVIKPENPGENGMDVHGAIVKPKKVYRKTFKYGKNLKVSDSGYELITEVTGHVSLEGEKIFVSNEYEIGADVDNTTGDIDFDGNVHVKGNVIAGFKIKATGNVRVDGVVEGAEITAGGDIILGKGIQGMNKGVLIADGNIAATFVENAVIKAGRDIDANAILHSKVSAGGVITIHGKKGFVVGGSIRSAGGIEAKVIGSEMGTSTVVGVGNDPELVARVDELKKLISKTGSDKMQLNKLIEALRQKREAEGSLDEAKTEMLQKSMRNVILLESQLKELKKEYDMKSEKVSGNKDTRIKVTGTIYPGVKLEIADLSMFVRDKNNFCQYAIKEGEIQRLNL